MNRMKACRFRTANGLDRILRRRRDGSGPAAGAPSIRREPPRGAPLPPSCIPNTWDETGKRKAETAIGAVCTHEGRISLRLTSAHQAIHFTPQSLGGRGKSRAPGVDDNIPLAADFRQAQPQRFANPPPGTISFDGASECAWHGEAESWTLARQTLHRQTKRGEQRAGVAEPILVNDAEVRSLQNSGGFRQRKASRRTGRLSHR